MIKKFIISLLAISVAGSAASYEPETHRLISRNAAEQSFLSNQTTFGRLGLVGSFAGGNGLLFSNSASAPMTVQNLIGFGSVWEDNLSKFQATRHFFNPRNGQGLTGTLLGMDLSGDPSPYWAVDGGTSDTDPRSGQAYSYKRAKDYLYNALTKEGSSCAA